MIDDHRIFEAGYIGSDDQLPGSSRLGNGNSPALKRAGLEHGPGLTQQTRLGGFVNKTSKVDCGSQMQFGGQAFESWQAFAPAGDGEPGRRVDSQNVGKSPEGHVEIFLGAA